MAGAREALTGARAALSEEDLNVKTHRGTCHLFHERFVAAGRFEKSLYQLAQDAQELREEGDYAAQAPSEEQARAVCEQAERFVDEVSRMLGD